MQQARGQEDLVLAGADLGAHQLRAGCQDTGVLLVEVDAGHGRHVVDVVVISEHRGAQRCSMHAMNIYRDYNASCKITQKGRGRSLVVVLCNYISMNGFA